MQTRTDVTVRRIDLDDDEALRQWYEVTETADAYGRPWAFHYSLEEFLIGVRDSSTSRKVLSAAYDGDEMVGGAKVELPMLDNTNMGWGSVLVHPDRRREGIGSALVRDVRAIMREEGRDTYLADAGIPADQRDTHPSSLFAFAHGASISNVEVHRVLDVPLEVDRIHEMQAEAAPHHAGYAIRTFEDHIPDELVPSYVYLTNQLAVDAPTGDVDFEAEGVTPEIHYELVAKMLRQGRHKLTTLAVTPDGEAVAVTDLMIPQEDRPKVYQWATLVRRDHRGHYLGAAVKLQNLLALQERYPERTEIHTTNAETNATMIGINERLGFRVVEICPEYVLRL